MFKLNYVKMSSWVELRASYINNKKPIKYRLLTAYSLIIREKPFTAEPCFVAAGNKVALLRLRAK
jgi:hypothetical protein